MEWDDHDLASHPRPHSQQNPQLFSFGASWFKNTIVIPIWGYLLFSTFLTHMPSDYFRSIQPSCSEGVDTLELGARWGGVARRGPMTSSCLCIGFQGGKKATTISWLHSGDIQKYWKSPLYYYQISQLTFQYFSPVSGCSSHAKIDAYTMDKTL